jgi:hypothetical protein
MSKARERFLELVGVLVALSGISGILYISISAIRALRNLPREVGVPVGVAAVTVIGSVIAVLVAKRLEHRRDVEQQLRAQKAEIYEEFINFMFKVVLAEQLGIPQPSEVEMKNFFAVYTPKLIIWGSASVIQALNKFKAVAASDAGQGIASAIALLMAIRDDLGHKPKLPPLELLKAFVRDDDLSKMTEIAKNTEKFLVR